VITITNAAGRNIDFDAAAVLMDKEITDQIDRIGSDGEQDFFDNYCALHLARFGEEFEPNKKNPVW
jgi:hypothetical protein